MKHRFATKKTKKQKNDDGGTIHYYCEVPDKNHFFYFYQKSQNSSLVEGQGEVFRRNHSIRLAESIKTKRSIVTFLKSDRFLLLCLSNRIYCSKIFSSTTCGMLKNP